MLNFHINTLYTQTIPFQYGLVTTDKLGDDVKRILADGRASCHLVQEHLALQFDNLWIDSIQTRGSGNLKTREVIRLSNRNERYVVRTITNRGLSLLPAKNIGYGRHFDKSDFNELLNQIAGYIIVDVRHGTCISYGAIAKDRIPKMRQLDARDANYYLEQGKTRVSL